MGKSVYSLILTDEVIDSVDRLAYQMHTSRSNMIDRILAEHVSLLTPQQRIQNVFDEIQNLLLPSDFQLLMKPSASMLSLRSALSYKYNPTIRYSIEMVRGSGQNVLRLKMQLRSQNQLLLDYLEEFFKLWAALEKQKDPQTESLWAKDGVRYIRNLRLPEKEITDEEYGERIAAYVQALDSAMNRFFTLLDTPEEAVAAVKEEFTAYAAGADEML